MAEPEYGTDAVMLHFDPQSREIENGWVEFQVKATDQPSFADDQESVACVVEMAHLHFWYWQVAHPFILVLYDANKHRAFWVDVQAYVDQHVIDDRENVTIRIPTENKLTVAAIDQFRRLSLARQQPQK